MTEPIKPKRRVTAQIPITSSPKLQFNPTSSPSAASSTASRPIRARINPSASGSSTPTSRPSLRPSQSSTSIRSSASLPAVPTLQAIPGRPRSPVRARAALPPISSAGGVVTPGGGGGTRARVRASSPTSAGLNSPLNQSYAQNTSTPVATGERVRARVTNITPVSTVYPRPKGFPSEPTPPEDPAGLPPLRAKARSQTQPPLTPLPTPRSRDSSVVSASSSSALQPKFSSPLASPVSPHQHLQTPGAGPSIPSDRRRSLSPVHRVLESDGFAPPLPPANRPYPLTPTLSPISSIANRFAQDPTASCPTSPHHAALPASVIASRPNGYTRKLPDHPYAIRPAALDPPKEPELRIVDLPPLTPAVSNVSQEGEGGGTIGLGLEGGISGLGLDDGGVRVEVLERPADLGVKMGGEAGGSEGDGGHVHGGLEGDEINEQIDEVVEEARMNRKVADLEISNASLLAINRSLEISKSKQRAEILRLRRALRESLAGPILPSGSSSSYFPSSTPRPYPSSPFSRMFDTPHLEVQPADGEEEDEEEPGLEADLEERWAKLEDVLGTMQKRAEVAVRAVAEESRPVGRTVLGGWEDEEGEEGAGTGTGGIGTPERQGEG